MYEQDNQTIYIRTALVMISPSKQTPELGIIQLMKSINHQQNLSNIIVIDLQVGSSFVLVSENSSGLHNIFSASLTPRDLLRIPNMKLTITINREAKSEI